MPILPVSTDPESGAGPATGAIGGRAADAVGGPVPRPGDGLVDAGSVAKSEGRGGYLWTGDLPAVLFIILFVVGVFAKTVFRGMSISRFFLVTHWDSLLTPFQCGVPMQVDPSTQLESIPNYVLAAHCYHTGGFPLWNHLNTFGAPLIADMQATVLSPLRLIFDIWPTSYAYNLQLVTQVLVCAVGTYWLARVMGALRLPSVLAACAFAVCPFMLWYLELQSGVGYVLYPLVLWLFARAGRNRRPVDALWAGVGVGATILTGHPEPSFFAGMFGTILMAMMCVPSAGYRTFAKLLAVAAATAFCIDAPVLLPFVEFLKNGDCYKFGVSQSLSLSWQAVAYNLLAPGAGGASPYLGILTVCFVPLAFGGKQKSSSIYMAILAVLALIPAANFFPYNLLCKIPPFSYLITVYLLPLFLLSVSVLAALGLTRLSEWESVGRGSMRFDAVVAVLLLAAAAPFALHLFNVPLTVCNFDLTLPDSAFNLAAWRRDTIVAAIFACAVVLIGRFWPRRVGWTMMALALVLNLVSVGAVAKTSLPPQPNFELPNLLVTSFLSESGERVLTTGKHILKPNLNTMWGIDNVTSSNVMWPKRYLKFITACGASVDQYTQAFLHGVSGLLDLGSVRYVLSQAPLLCPQDQPHSLTALTELSLPATLVSGLSIDDAGLWRSETEASAGGVLHLSGAEANKHSKLQLVLELRNKHGFVIWFSDRLPLEPEVAFTIPVAPGTADQYTLSARVFDTASSLFATLTDKQDSLPLSTLPASTTSATAPHFKFVKELPGIGIRLYENTGSLPRAYVAFAGEAVSSEQAAFAAITAPSFNAHKSVILEDSPLQISVPATAMDVQPAKIVIRKAEEVAVEYSTDRPGWLVLTDTFYPGWKAYLDGHAVPVLRANYLFRAVSAPAGKHVLIYRYVPIPFYLGLILFISFVLTVALVAMVNAFRHRSVPPIK